MQCGASQTLEESGTDGCRLHAAGLGPGYLGRFANGRVEEFLEDHRTLTPHDLSLPPAPSAPDRTPLRGAAAADPSTHNS